MNATPPGRLLAAVLSLAAAGALAACGSDAGPDGAGPDGAGSSRQPAAASAGPGGSPTPGPSPSRVWPADCSALLGSFASATFATSTVEPKPSGDLTSLTLCGITGMSSRLSARVGMIVAIDDPAREKPDIGPAALAKALRGYANEMTHEVCTASFVDLADPGGKDKLYGRPVPVPGAWDYAKGCMSTLGTAEAAVAVVTKGLAIVARVRTTTKLKDGPARRAVADIGIGAVRAAVAGL